MVYESKSNKNELDINDLKQWIRNTLIFSIPTLVALQGLFVAGVDPKVVFGAAYSAFIGSLIDLGKKFIQGG